MTLLIEGHNMEVFMRRSIVILSLSLLWAGCIKDNPVSQVTKTIESDNLQVTFSIPRPSYGIHDTLRATTTVYNPGDTTIRFAIPVCWPIAWYSVQDSRGTTRLSYSAPRDYGCASAIEYSILPHQSQQISLLQIMIAIVDLEGTQNAQGSYVLATDNGFGTFSLKFTVN